MINPDAYFRDVWVEQRKKQRTAEKKWTEPILSSYSSVEYSVERLSSGCILYWLHATYRNRSWLLCYETPLSPDRADNLT
jgi:hypothetical protein